MYVIIYISNIPIYIYLPVSLCPQVVGNQGAPYISSILQSSSKLGTRLRVSTNFVKRFCREDTCVIGFLFAVPSNGYRECVCYGPPFACSPNIPNLPPNCYTRTFLS